MNSQRLFTPSTVLLAVGLAAALGCGTTPKASYHAGAPSVSSRAAANGGLEITADRGRLVYENDTLTFTRNATLTSNFSRKSKDSFAAPATTTKVLPVSGHGGQHQAVTQNFVDAITKGAALIAPAAEGIASVELANAMLWSACSNRTVTLPLDGAKYARHLRQLIAASKFEKTVAAHAAPLNFTKSFNTS